MKITIKVFLFLFIICSYAQAKSQEEQITETVSALPEAPKGNTNVIGFDQSREEIISRNGTNKMICWADNPNRTDKREYFFVVRLLDVSKK